MRHNKSINHLGRKSGHRKALLANMASSLILKKRIFTTVAKAKALQSYVEPLITKSKDDSTITFSYWEDGVHIIFIAIDRVDKADAVTIAAACFYCGNIRGVDLKR